MADASSFRVQCMVAIHAQLVYNLQQHRDYFCNACQVGWLLGNNI